MKYPRLRDLEVPARRRIPPFVFAYLDSGTGHDVARQANRDYYDAITLTPRFLRGRVDADLSTSILGQNFEAPFGVAPIGLSSMIWPGAEKILASAAASHGFPYTLSTVAGIPLKMWQRPVGRIPGSSFMRPRTGISHLI